MAKYTFETTTVGEMLDTPEIMELINKYIPAPFCYFTHFCRDLPVF